MLPILCLKPRCYSDEDIVDDLENDQVDHDILPDLCMC